MAEVATDWGAVERDALAELAAVFRQAERGDAEGAVLYQALAEGLELEAARREKADRGEDPGPPPRPDLRAAEGVPSWSLRNAAAGVVAMRQAARERGHEGAAAFLGTLGALLAAALEARAVADLSDA